MPSPDRPGLFSSYITNHSDTRSGWILGGSRALANGGLVFWFARIAHDPWKWKMSTHQRARHTARRCRTCSMLCSDIFLLAVPQTTGSCKNIATVCEAKLSPRRPAFSIRPAEHHEVYNGEVRLETTLRCCLEQLALVLSIPRRWGNRRDRERAKRRIKPRSQYVRTQMLFSTHLWRQ